MTIFLDAIWLLNFFFDLLLLLITRIFIKRKTPFNRLLFGAFVASIIVPINVFYPTSFFATFLGKLVYSFLIVLCAFPIKSFFSLMHYLLSFYFISFVIGGALLGVHFLLNHPISITEAGVVTFNKGYGDPISWLFVVIGFPIVGYFTKHRLDKYEIEKLKYNQLYTVFITIKQIEKETQGYLDSGNQLIDPLTKYPVIICDEPFLKQWFTKDDWQTLKQLSVSLNPEMIPKQWKGKINFIPYRGVDGKNQIIIAIKPDEVIVLSNGEEISTKAVFIGIQFSTLSEDGSYHCLLHPKLFQRKKSIA